MRGRVNRGCVVWTLLGLALSSPLSATGAPTESQQSDSDEGDAPFQVAEPKDELDRWVPAVSIFSGVLITGLNAAVVSDTLSGSDPAEPLRPPAAGSINMLNPFVGVAVELSTPGLDIGWGRPRAFIHGDVIGQFGFGQDVAREGAPDVMEDPMKSVWPEEGIFGQGSTTGAKLNSPVLAAGAGVAFSFEWLDRRFRIKPSIEFVRERFRIEGSVHRAKRLTVGSPPIPGNPPVPGVPSTFQFIEIDASTNATYYSLGPGLELEADVARAGPLLLSLGIKGRYYQTLGDRSVTLRGSDVTGKETATFYFEKQPWSAQASLEFRFRWSPE
jgi:hypothetical protein